MKRNSIFLVVLTLSLSVFFGCKDSKQPTEAKIIGGLVDEEVIDTTIYGRCVDGGMSSLLLVNESG
ncbi:MAG: hypothetical protein IKI07_00720, partial [Prevotella sp.]|nr:hypothetical protein [Prevotella sp.]